MAQRAITLSDIKSADWSLMLDSAGQPGSGIGGVVMGVDDVDQCIAIILTTPKGSDVLRPTFGTDLWKYIDAPISEAGPAVVREVIQSITQWEPRVKVLSVYDHAAYRSCRAIGRACRDNRRMAAQPGRRARARRETRP